MPTPILCERCHRRGRQSLLGWGDLDDSVAGGWSIRVAARQGTKRAGTRTVGFWPDDPNTRSRVFHCRGCGREYRRKISTLCAELPIAARVREAVYLN